MHLLYHIKVCLGTHLFVKVPQPGDSEVTFSVLESSFHLLLPVWPFKGRSNPVKCLAQGHNKQTCQPISTLTLYMLIAKRPARKLRIPTYKVFWFDLARLAGPSQWHCARSTSCCIIHRCWSIGKSFTTLCKIWPAQNINFRSLAHEDSINCSDIEVAFGLWLNKLLSLCYPTQLFANSTGIYW